MIEIYQGDSFSVSTPVYNEDGTQKDISGAIGSVLIAKSGSATAIISKSATVSGNKFVVDFVEADTIDVKEGIYTYQLRTGDGVVLVEEMKIKKIIKPA